jgi:butyrate kinase
MSKTFKVLVINPGSTSTKLALYAGGEPVWSHKLIHKEQDLKNCPSLKEQYPFRKREIEDLIASLPELKEIDAVIGRGAPLKPMEGGTYTVNELLYEDLLNFRLQTPHISFIGGLIAYDLGKNLNIPAFIADPISVDEFHPLARLSGHPAIPRKSLWHALNCKAVARKAAAALGKTYLEVNLIVVHLGGGITVSAHQQGKAIDVSNASSEGPFSPERCGTLPLVEFIDWLFSHNYNKVELLNIFTRESGLKGYLGTNNAEEIERNIKQGDRQAALIYEAMAYQVSKEIGAYAAVLKGKVEAIAITGGLAHSQMLIDWIKERISWIAPLLVFPGEDEMRALAEAALRVLEGEEETKEYR